VFVCGPVFVRSHICFYHYYTKNKPPIIGATCAFDAKIYKNAGGVYAVSVLSTGNKKNYQISDFSSQLPSLLVEIPQK